MAFANPLPWWALPLVIGLAALVAWQAYRRLAVPRLFRYSLTALRFLTLIAILVFLMRPVARSSETDARSAIVPIVVDTSRSMGIDDAGGLRRIDRARELLTRMLLPALQARFQVEILSFGDRVRPVTLDRLSATARTTDLHGALATVRQQYRGRAVAGIILLSDGGDTETGPRSGVEEGPAIFAFGLGRPDPGRDVEVLSVTAAEAILDESRVDLAAAAVSHGRGTEAIDLRLMENGRPIEVRRLDPAADGTPVHTVFQVSPGRSGPTVYTVEVSPQPGDLVPENNSRSTLVQPPSRSRRVLLVEGAPGFEHSFLKRAWSADPGLEIDSVVRKGRTEQGRDTFYIQAVQSRSASLRDGYPHAPEDLYRYDALVLANVDGDQLTRAQLDATRDFVGRRGGGLLVLGARALLPQGLVGTVIEDVLPLNLRDRAGGVLPAAVPRAVKGVTLTADGEAHPVMQLAPGREETRKRWEAFPALSSTAPLGGPRPGAAVLALTSGAGGAPRALVAVQRFGEGRSMIFAGEASWRWRMLLPATDRAYDTFWRQAVRWLALPAADPIALLLPSGAPADSAVPIHVTVRNAKYEPLRDVSVDVRITAPDGRTAQAPGVPEADAPSSGRYVARVKAGDAGVYRVTVDVRRDRTLVGSATSSLLVGGADLEMTDPRLNVQVLQRLAAESGGRVVTERDIQSVVQALAAAAPAAAVSVRRDLWHNGWSFAAILALLGAEWVLRRRLGLR